MVFRKFGTRGESMFKENIRFILFDFLGTVVDWHGSIVDELKKNSSLFGKVDFDIFANRWWEEGYIQSTRAIAKGAKQWCPVEQITMEKLNDLLAESKIDLPSHEKDQINAVLRKLKPWDDVVEGLTLLKENFFIAPLTNGDLTFIASSSKSAAMPWDFILTGSMFKRYKPDPQIFLDVLSMLEAKASEVLLAAAHTPGLNAAKAAGYRTAFVRRPLEFGPGLDGERPSADSGYDCMVGDFMELANLLS